MTKLYREALFVWSIYNNNAEDERIEFVDDSDPGYITIEFRRSPLAYHIEYFYSHGIPLWRYQYDGLRYRWEYVIMQTHIPTILSNKILIMDEVNHLTQDQIKEAFKHDFYIG